MWHQCQADLAKQKGRYARLRTAYAARGRRITACGRAKRLLSARLKVETTLTAKLKIKIATDAEKIAELNRQKEAMRKRTQLFRSLALKLRDMIKAGNLKVVIRKGRMIVKMSDNILFSAGKARLKGGGKDALRKLAAVLKEITGRDFMVAGHTDNKPVRRSRFKSNWSLSVARAVEVVKFLQSEGMDPKRLSATGFSEFDPIGNNNTPEGRAMNRRIEIVVMPKISELPPIEPLEGSGGS
jgi:chemotaxis protein MotB